MLRALQYRKPLLVAHPAELRDITPSTCLTNFQRWELTQTKSVQQTPASLAVLGWLPHAQTNLMLVQFVH